MSIGTQIRDARKKLKLTQKELAEKTHLSRSHIGAIERDAYNPSISTLENIANILNTPIKTFLTDDEVSDISADKNVDDIDAETRALANELKKNPDFCYLLKATKKLKSQSLKEVKSFIAFKLQNDLDEFA